MNRNWICGASLHSASRVIAIIDLVFSAFGFLNLLLVTSWIFSGTGAFQTQLHAYDNVRRNISWSSGIDPEEDPLFQSDTAYDNSFAKISVEVEVILMFILLKSLFNFCLSIFLLHGANTFSLNKCTFWWWSNLFLLLPTIGICFQLVILLSTNDKYGFSAAPLLVLLLTICYKIYCLLIVRGFIEAVNNGYGQMKEELGAIPARRTEEFPISNLNANSNSSSIATA